MFTQPDPRQFDPKTKNKGCSVPHPEADSLPSALRDDVFAIENKPTGAHRAPRVCPLMTTVKKN